MNDIPLEHSNSYRAGQFADDMNAWATGTNKGKVHYQLQQALSSIEKWCSLWRIKLNVNKTQLTAFGLTKPLTSNFRRTNKDKGKGQGLRLFNTEIKESSKFKILGVTFDKGGSTSSYCKERVKIAHRRTCLLRLISGRSWGANSQTKLTLYKQYIRPVLEYGSVATADTKESNVRLLALAERRALRYVFNLPKSSNVNDLYLRAGIERIEDRLKNNKAKAVARFGNSSGIQQLQIIKQWYCSTHEQDQQGS